MALSAQNLLDLKNADQRFQAHCALFAVYTPTIVPPSTADGVGTLLTPKPMIMFSPRYSMVDNSGTIDLYAGDSYVRGGAAAGTKNWSTDAGSLSAATGDTVTFTAPAAGSGVATITITCDNANGTSTSYAYVSYPKNRYDEMVSEIASISGSLDQHGWRALVRVRGTATDFTIGKRILLHIEDTWAGTTSTFGGYKYPEGVLVGIITEAEYFQDWTGESWLGLEVQSPWWIMEQIKLGEIWWGYTSEGGKYFLSDFAPVDAVWKMVQDLTDFSKQFNVVMWFDQNVIDDFITEEADLAALVEDIMARTLSITYCDRYGSLFCVPDPDVRADEYWGTPASTYTLTPDFVMSYHIKQKRPPVRKLTLAAFDASKLGIWGVSENPTAPGTERTIRGLLCDRAATLASWAVQKRAQMNRLWTLEAEHPLNHVLDLNNFVDAIFTAPTQAGALTASAQCYTDSISYRPDISDGGWQGNIRYLKRTEGDGESETGGISGWGGTGNNWTGRPLFSGSGNFDSGGWGSGTGGPTFLHLFDFTVSDQGWTIQKHPNGSTGGTYAGAAGWQGTWVPGSPGAVFVLVSPPEFPSRNITGIRMYGVNNAANNYMEIANYAYESGGSALYGISNQPAGNLQALWSGQSPMVDVLLYARAGTSGANVTIVSAIVAGYGGDPF